MIGKYLFATGVVLGLHITFLNVYGVSFLPSHILSAFLVVILFLQFIFLRWVGNFLYFRGDGLHNFFLVAAIKHDSEALCVMCENFDEKRNYKDWEPASQVWKICVKNYLDFNSWILS